MGRLAFRLARTLRNLLAECVVLALLLAVAVLLPRGSAIEGQASVIDGDSLRIGEHEIRLLGLDAPEYRQTCRAQGADWPCGRQARDALRAMTQMRELSCIAEGYDRYGRTLAYCRSGEDDINAMLVRQGWAVASGDFEPEEVAATREKVGIWRGEFDLPRDHRAGRRRFGWLSALDWPWTFKWPWQGE
ncbi:thermonuclease family protein [Tepidamorphus sp. 3E244]|uniref:thermonuclease family protein n=1 Tax=Tepidamorphus sp. 3E244 TaxID=3385498 RepID=UPI0038FCD9B5